MSLQVKLVKYTNFLTPVHISSDWTVEWSMPPSLIHLEKNLLSLSMSHIYIDNRPTHWLPPSFRCRTAGRCACRLSLSLSLPQDRICRKRKWKNCAMRSNISSEKSTLSFSINPLFLAIFLYQYPASWSAIITFGINNFSDDDLFLSRTTFSPRSLESNLKQSPAQSLLL